MDTAEVLDILNGKKRYPKLNTELKRKAGVYYGISLHTLGACPKYADVRNGGMVEPVGYYGGEYQKIFDTSLLARHPRESETTRNWRLSQYRPLTKAPFSRTTELVTGAIFQDGNYSVEISNQRDYDYIWGNNFHGNSLIGYFANMGYKNMIEDPNGYFLRMPKYKWDETPNGSVEVEIWFINSKDIKYLSATDIIFCRDDYAWHVDERVIFRYARKGTSNQFELLAEDAEGYYAHMFGRLPISIAGGEWNSQGYYDSFYEKAKAAADDFISAYSAAQLVDKEASHPFIVEASEDCKECDGTGKVQRDCDTCPGGLELVSCGDCGGSGQKATDPATRKIVPFDKMKDGQLVQIINPDTSVNEHHRKTTEGIMKMILEALVLEIIDEAQSGSAKAIDQDRLYKFISKISNHMFDNLIYQTLVDIIAYRNVVASPTGVQPAVYDFKIIKPSQFQIKTEKDLLDEYKTASEAKLPKFMLVQQTKAIVDKQYSGDDVMKKKTDVILAVDRIALDTTDEKLSKRLANSITTDDMVFSDTLPLILDEIVRDKGNEWFINAKIADIKKEVDQVKTTFVSESNNPLQNQAINNME